MDGKKEQFADNAEFHGAGVPADKAPAPDVKPEEGKAPGEPGAPESQDGLQDGGAENRNGQPGDSGAKTDSPDSPLPSGAKTDDQKAPAPDAKPEAAKAPEEPGPDPLDLPIAKWEDVDLGLGDAPVDKAVMDAYGKMCVELKLSPRQAASLARFQLETVNSSRERLTREAIAELGKEWGSDAQTNQQAIVNLVNQVDQAMGDKSFSDALQDSGVACYASFARGLLALTRMLAEDSLGPTSKGQGSPKPETAYEGLMEVFSAARK